MDFTNVLLECSLGLYTLVFYCGESVASKHTIAKYLYSVQSNKAILDALKGIVELGDNSLESNRMRNGGTTISVKGEILCFETNFEAASTTCYFNITNNKDQLINIFEEIGRYLDSENEDEETNIFESLGRHLRGIGTTDTLGV